MMEKVAGERIDITKSPYDLKTVWGRFKHYAWVTDPKLTLVSSQQLYTAKSLVEQYKKGEEPLGTTVEEARRAQQMYLSAFHPDSGQIQNVFGRMSFYVPGGLVLIFGMTVFYKSTAAVMFWQWANQSFNALVNYTNSNATSESSNKRLLIAYTSATSSALAVSLGLKKLLAGKSSPMLQRLVPFAAVAAANAVNIPLMRQSELTDGVLLSDRDGNEVAKSKYAAVKGISQVTASRIFMATPSMTLLPWVMEKLEKTKSFRRYKILGGVTNFIFSGMLLLVFVPLGCAIFPQQCSISSKQLDYKTVEELKKQGRLIPERLYFNKGL